MKSEMKPWMHIVAVLIIIGGGGYVATIEVYHPWEKALIMVILFLVAVYGNYLSAYVEKAGKNLATKEDIKEITKLTEEIKNDLELVNESRLSFQTMKREAVINYYELYMQWLNFLMNALIENSDETKMNDKFQELMSNHNNAASRLRLFDEKHTDYDAITLAIATLTLQLQNQYLFELNRYFSITSNIHLKPEIVNHYNNHKTSEYEKIVNLLKTLIPIFRERIKGTVKAGQKESA